MTSGAMGRHSQYETLEGKYQINGIGGTRGDRMGFLRSTSPLSTLAYLYLDLAAQIHCLDRYTRVTEVRVGLRFFIERATSGAALIGAECCCQVARSGR